MNTRISGKLFEWDVLGRGRAWWDGQTRVRFYEAVRKTKTHQPAGWDPSDPPTRLANDLHALVAEELGLKNYSELALFNSLDTPLDYFFGTDCFFEFRGWVVSVDITTNPEKQSYKANVIALESDFENRDSMTLLASKIAHEFWMKGAAWFVARLI